MSDLDIKVLTNMIIEHGEEEVELEQLCGSIKKHKTGRLILPKTLVDFIKKLNKKGDKE